MHSDRPCSVLAVATFALAFALSPPARAADYTDIWWAPCAPGPNCDAATGHESGWGVNFVQDEDVVFATFYIYDAAKNPMWVSSPMFVNASGSSYTGNLYRSTGSFFGNPWNPNDVPNPLPAVGTAAFVPNSNSATSGTLTYTVNNVPGIPNTLVKKNIERSNFRTILLTGSYAGTTLITLSGCTNNADNGTTLYDIDPNVTQFVDGTLQFDFVFVTNSETCTMTGAGIQQGQLYSVPSAKYSCTVTTGINTTSTLYEVKATALGIEGRWTAKINRGCQEDGRFNALLLP